jgi:hypothetical protein
LQRAQLLHDLREWLAAGESPSLGFLLGSEAPSADARSAVTDAVLRFVQGTGRHVLLPA